MDTSSEFVSLELVKLESPKAEGKEAILLNCLNTEGFREDWFGKNWVSFVSDRACVMLGKNSGVATRNFNLCTWHCMSHRLKLAVYGVNDKI